MASPRRARARAGTTDAPAAGAKLAPSFRNPGSHDANVLHRARVPAAWRTSATSTPRHVQLRPSRRMVGGAAGDNGSASHRWSRTATAHPFRRPSAPRSASVKRRLRSRTRSPICAARARNRAHGPPFAPPPSDVQPSGTDDVPHRRRPAPRPEPSMGDSRAHHISPTSRRGGGALRRSWCRRTDPSARERVKGERAAAAEGGATHTWVYIGPRCVAQDPLG